MSAQEPPLVSVVIPCYNQAHFLGEAIESVLAQTYRSFEIVVVDDGSTDNTSEIATRYPEVRCIRQENKGLSGARNAGLRESKGSFLVFLDADDRLLPSALEVGLQQLEAHLECAMVSGHCTLIANDGSSLHTPQQHHVTKDHYVELLRGNYIWNPATVMYRRAIFRSVGGFDTAVSPAADYDLYLRIAKETPVYCHGKVVAEYRQHKMNMSGDPTLMLESVSTVLRSQWQHVAGHKRYEDAYESGVTHYRDKYGDSPRLKEAHALRRIQAALRKSKIPGEHASILNQTLLDKFRPTIPDVVATAESNDGGPYRKTILVVGVYLANVPSNVDDIVATLSDSTEHAVNQRWVALGGRPPTERVADVTARAVLAESPKFELVNKLLTEEDLTQYGYVFVLEDDVVLPHRFLDKFVSLQADLAFSIAQPALTSNSYIDYPILEQQRGVTARQTLFVGAGPVTCFHDAVYDLAFPVDPTTPTGWRYRERWSCLLAERDLKMGIVDVTPVDHSLRKPAETIDKERTSLLETDRFPYEEALSVLEIIPYCGRQKEVRQQ